MSASRCAPLLPHGAPGPRDGSSRRHGPTEQARDAEQPEQDEHHGDGDEDGGDMEAAPGVTKTGGIVDTQSIQNLLAELRSGRVEDKAISNKLQLEILGRKP